uniref:receptor protein-tyrosine kinase n=1 Tax=Plectus sambesii TaxID=2011161 RepID=A0A914UPL6_9BILA
MLDKYATTFPDRPFPLSVLTIPICISHSHLSEGYSPMFPPTKLNHLIVPHKPEDLLKDGLPYLDFCNNFIPSSPDDYNGTTGASTSSQTTQSINDAQRTKSGNAATLLIVFAAVLFFFVLICLTGMTILARRKRENIREEVIVEIASRERCFTITSRISTAADNVSYSYPYLEQQRCKYEIAPEMLTVDRTTELGKGAFAVVFKGHLTGAAPVVGMIPSLSVQYYQNCDVAVKTILEHADETQRLQFMREITILTKLGFHNHIVNLLGCVTTGQEKYLVMELAETDLLEYVRTLTTEYPPLRCLLSIAWQVADGMTFISSRHFIHCDLAARNVLLTNGQKAMISDFGLCHFSESGRIKKPFGKMPVRHMALESLQKHEFSESSDVWSFGVVLYEMYSRGAVPYEKIDIKDICDHLSEGERLERPELACDEIYDVMQSTWKEVSSDRPNFSQIRSTLADLLEQSSDYYGYVVAHDDHTCINDEPSC